MNYKLNTSTTNGENKSSVLGAVRKLLTLIKDEKKNVLVAFIAIITNSGFTLLGPLIVGFTIDRYVQNKDFHGVLVFSGILLVVYALAFVANYIQMRAMGGVAQRMLFTLRNTVFTKIQSLPIAFFNQNKAGDLISRINNDTDKLNQFFSQGLMQFAGSIFIIIGAGIFVLVLNPRLAIASLIPALLVFIFIRLTSKWIKQRNVLSLRAEGALSAEIQESLANFKVVVAYNRRDYFRERFMAANKENFRTSIIASVGNGIFTPLFDFASNIAQLTVLGYGIYLIIHGQLGIGLLISFVMYINRFYDPLRQIASLWASAQVALAGWDRISEILAMESDLAIISADQTHTTNSLIELKDVNFGYPGGKTVLENVSLKMEAGKTYALVGPTGGGKTTTASLIARLFDPLSGEVFLDEKSIRAYTAEERSKKIGFILQEPFLFSGTIKDNIVYGNPELLNYTTEQVTNLIKQAGIEKLLERFDQGIETQVTSNSESLSLGQRQLIAFMRAVLRNPDVLILDEATANIDTVTEQLLEEILKKLPQKTTRIIIAHRLNTIENADEIFFVNGGTITAAGSFDHAVEMLLHGKSQS